MVVVITILHKVVSLVIIVIGNALTNIATYCSSHQPQGLPANLCDSKDVILSHEHVLIKEPGTSIPLGIMTNPAIV